MRSGRLSFLLATSNGIGMGHLSRQLAVALAGSPDVESTLLSLSVGLPTVTSEEISGEYCPGPDRGWMPEVVWPLYLRDRLIALAREIDADAVVFDGVAPYRGVSLAKQALPETPFVWFRRGMWREGVNAGQLWKSDLFDFIIEPGDLASDDDIGPTANRQDALRVAPVSLADVIERVSREEAGAALDVDPERPVLLLTLGTGRLGDVSTPGSMILDAIPGDSDWQILVTRPDIATEAVPVQRDGVIEIRGIYPLVRYLNLFDAVVSAAGYNAVHEFVSSGVPTLLIPNTDTRTDHQEGRASSLARRGLALTADAQQLDDMREGLSRLLDSEEREAIARRVQELPTGLKSGGAAETSQTLQRLIGEYEPAEQTTAARVRRLRDDAKEGLKRRLGPEGTNRVRGLLGRPPIKSGKRLEVEVIDGESPPNPDATPLTLSSSPSTRLLLDGDPVEHVLEGASSSYVAARRLIIDHYYDVI